MMPKPRPRLKIVLSVLLSAFILWQFGSAAKIHAKALLAQYLIAHSWQQALEHPEQPLETYKPWSWADTWPVARMQWIGKAGEVTRPDADVWVLSGADGSSLAFGPGHLHGTAMPGEGATVFAGHRDTHFQFLQAAQVGDLLRVQTRQGLWLQYQVAHVSIVDSAKKQLRLDVNSKDLWLVTCYPFNGVSAGGTLRYQLRAKAVF